MELATIKALAGSPAKLSNIHATHARITELETALGEPHGPRIFNIIEANRRVGELQAKLALKNSATQPGTASAPTASAPAVITISTDALETIASAISPGRFTLPASAPESARRAAIAAMFWKARLTYPGSDADFANLDTSKLDRHVSNERHHGQNRSATAFSQATIDAMVRDLPRASGNSITVTHAPAGASGKPLVGRERMKASLKIV